jgi:hypothetical protein
MSWRGVGGLAVPSAVQVSVTHPAVAATVAVTGTGTQELDPADWDSSYIDVLNHFTSVFTKGDDFTVLADGRVQVNQNCDVDVIGYLDAAHSANNATVGVVFTVERSSVRVLSARAVHSRMPNSDDIGSLSGTGMLSAQAGDIIGIALASDVTGTIRIHSSSITFKRI